jgi:26S proteasome regulatory subunit N7
MPIDSGEDAIEKNPNLTLAQLKFLLEQPELSAKHSKGEIGKQLYDVIQKENMAPFYEELVRDVNNEVVGKLPETVVAQMKEMNTAKIQEYDAFIEDAEKNLTEMEVRENNLKKAEYLCRIGAKDDAITAFRKTYEKTVSLGQRLDIVFHQIRIGLFYMDHDLISRNIEKARSLIDEGGDWDRRNRLKVYQVYKKNKLEEEGDCLTIWGVDLYWVCFYCVGGLFHVHSRLQDGSCTVLGHDFNVHV